jgi:hypothetical protein
VRVLFTCTPGQPGERGKPRVGSILAEDAATESGDNDRPDVEAVNWGVIVIMKNKGDTYKEEEDPTVNEEEDDVYDEKGNSTYSRSDQAACEMGYAGDRRCFDEQVRLVTVSSLTKGGMTSIRLRRTAWTALLEVPVN